MITEIQIDKNFKTSKPFKILEQGEAGDLCKIPYDEIRYNRIKQESQRRNMYARIKGEIGIGRSELKYKVMATDKKQTILVFRLI